MLWGQYKKLRDLKKDGQDKDLKDLPEYTMPSQIHINSKKELLKLQHMRKESILLLRNKVVIDLKSNAGDNDVIVESLSMSFSKLKCNEI